MDQDTMLAGKSSLELDRFVDQSQDIEEATKLAMEAFVHLRRVWQRINPRNNMAQRWAELLMLDAKHLAENIENLAAGKVDDYSKPNPKVMIL